ncbi:hypothetical protein BU15DRAFT_57069 [Melanogaster broomeanus]|nr:hypothetical protein BU15DRAFT_57069 [Melanogaster broomeanus]
MLAYKSRGYPLWVPEPYSRLPEDYHRTGLKTGDVSIVNEARLFDVLFNICLPENHPLHRRHGVPASFRQVISDDDDIIQLPSFDREGRVLKSSTTSNQVGALLGYEFTSSSSEGAILAFPEGATRTDLVDVHHFIQLAKKNAAAWYHFAYFHPGRAFISNDSLFLITGHHKASSWSLTSFLRQTQTPHCPFR